MENNNTNSGNPNENDINRQFAQQFGQQGGMGNQMVPNSTGVLVLGIISIVTCWAYGILGLILGIVALAMSGSGRKAYTENPSLYTQASYNNLKAGRICAIIGVSLSALFMIYVIIVLAFVGAALGSFGGWH
ncbi:MAG: CCC motif membrane protein [Bacteroidia bacterium]